MKKVKGPITLAHIACYVESFSVKHYSNIDICTRDYNKNLLRRVSISTSPTCRPIYIIEDCLLRIPIQRFLALYNLGLLELGKSNYSQIIVDDLIAHLNQRVSRYADENN